MRSKAFLVGLLVLGAIGKATAEPALDSAGKCRDKGKFVSAALCTAPVPAAKCRDMKTKKFAKCGAAGTEPVPAK